MSHQPNTHPSKEVKILILVCNSCDPSEHRERLPVLLRGDWYHGGLSTAHSYRYLREGT